jgi:hypothetical protein
MEIKEMGGFAFWMKKGATNGNNKKWWIRFLDEKRSNQWKQKEMVDSLFG